MDNDSSASGSIKDNPDNNVEERNEIKEVEKLTQKENLRVFLWHKLVTAFMIVTAIAITVTTYKILKGENADDYLTAYRLFTESIRDSAALNVKAVANAAMTFSATTSNYIVAMNTSWPFVTIPNFESQVENVKRSTRAERVLFLPHVDEENFEEWNSYSRDNMGWREASLLAYGRSDDLSVPIADIFYLDANRTSQDPRGVREGPYSPYWQSSPPMPRDRLNRDTLDFRTNRLYLNAIEASRGCVFGNMFDADYYVGEGLDYTPERHDELHAGFTDYPPEDVTRETGWATVIPHSSFLCPIFEIGNDKSSKIVGRYSYILPWDAFLTNLLPRGSKDLFAVVKNNNNQTATYILRGNNAIFIGWEDQHDSKHNAMAFSFDVTALAGIDAKEFEGVEDFLSVIYTVTIYPSSSFEDSYKNNTPVVFSVLVSIAFFIMTLTFFTYDYLVHRRNKKVVRTAANSNAIVSSLFPSTVRDRLFVNEEETDEEAPTSLMKRFFQQKMPDIFEDEKEEDRAETRIMDTSSPIADEFPEATVMFADIVGFTSWSSSRNPVAVFTLLESIYNAFDQIAKRRGVFKVETIGDCYLAVCGLPEPRKDHAVVMARFAAKCREMLPIITQELSETLGQETKELKMRIGLHSGSVTAGVLRGERSRFQLFGDTVNTAARMESTSKPGLIQMTKSTAELLKAAGKGNWFQAREDKVVAKGKGEMETYFLTKYTAAMSVSTALSSEKAATKVELVDESLDEATRSQNDESSVLYA